MNQQSSKKLSLKKETLRQVDAAQLNQLEGAVGGVTPIFTIGLATTVAVTIVYTIDSSQG